jgi:hypothetical protein
MSKPHGYHGWLGVFFYLLTEPAYVPGWFGVVSRCQHKSMDATMSRQSRRKTVAGVGELLWDLLPDGKQAAILNSGLIAAACQAAGKTFFPCMGRVPGPQAATGAPFGGTAPTREH